MHKNMNNNQKTLKAHAYLKHKTSKGFVHINYGSGEEMQVWLM